jgi:four helix bundle protein
MDKTELLRRTRIFAIKVFKLANRLPKSEASKVIVYQLLKAASSVAANYRAVNRAKSRLDFANKLKIVLEEADESNFWLTFISDVELLNPEDDELKFLVAESEEFVAIFTSSVKTSESRIDRSNQKSKIINLKS